MANDKLNYGRVRPAKGPYEKGVFNGPDPRTKRGWRRRKKNCANIPDSQIAKVDAD